MFCTLYHKILLGLVTVALLPLLASSHLPVLFIALIVTLLTAQILGPLLTFCTCILSVWRDVTVEFGVTGGHQPTSCSIIPTDNSCMHTSTHKHTAHTHYLRPWASLQIPAASVKDLTAGLHRLLAKKIPDLIIQPHTNTHRALCCPQSQPGTSEQPSVLMLVGCKLDKYTNDK